MSTASLAALLNSPTEFTVEIDGEERTFSLRQPTLLEAGQYQRWLEQEARAGAARATELTDEDRRNLLRDVQADIAAQRYAWGGEECVRSLRSQTGVAKLMSIVCGVNEHLARQAVEKNMLAIADLLVGELENDPTGKALGSLLRSVGLPTSFFHSSSSSSPTSPTAGTSANSGTSASDSSTPSS